MVWYGGTTTTTPPYHLMLELDPEISFPPTVDVIKIYQYVFEVAAAVTCIESADVCVAVCLTLSRHIDHLTTTRSLC
jgi:hypothetical protein